MYWQVLTDLPLPGTLPDFHAPALRTFSASLSTHFPFLCPRGHIILTRGTSSESLSPDLSL